MNYEDCSPRPGAMISSLRAFGYDLSMAIADLIDNSIFAQAQTIAVDYDWNSGDPWIRISDDGRGMTEARLKEAMRLGTQSPLDAREESDLGRFGLGLKTAAFSQCKLLTVCSKVHGRSPATRCWDLSHVETEGVWALGTEAPPGARPLLSVLDAQDSGTIVLCQKLDRLVCDRDCSNAGSEAFHESFGKVAQYLEMVFHRYLAGRESVSISVGRHRCEPWDPFLTRNRFTQQLSHEYLDGHRVEVNPFVLPHVSKRTPEETARGAGTYGWNAHQGFYIYRNKRIIILGGYLDLPFTAEDHYKLCRIQVDLPNNLDHEWAIDVRKAAASPPANVRSDLERIARATRAKAAEIYRARAGSKRRTSTPGARHEIWVRRRSGEKVVYQINRQNEAIARLLSKIKAPESWSKQLFHLIEKAVPHRLIIIDNAEREDCQVDLPPELHPPPRELINLCCQIFTERLSEGRDPHATADYACSFFDDHPAYRAALDELIEESG